MKIHKLSRPSRASLFPKRSSLFFLSFFSPPVRRSLQCIHTCRADHNLKQGLKPSQTSTQGSCQCQSRVIWGETHLTSVQVISSCISQFLFLGMGFIWSDILITLESVGLEQNTHTKKRQKADCNCHTQLTADIHTITNPLTLICRIHFCSSSKTLKV